MALADSIDTPVSGMAVQGDSIFFYGNTYNAQYQPVSTFGIINTNSCKVVNNNIITPPADNPIKTAYGIMVHPVTGDIYVMDATNYVSSGKLYCFGRDGKYKWVTWTGDIPGHAVFLSKTEKR